MSRTHRIYWYTCGALGIVALLWLLPTLWMVSLSFQPNDVLSRTTSNVALGLIPVPFTWENFVRLFTLGLTPRWFLNSVIVSGGMTLLVIVLSTTAGYAFARIPFRGRAPVYAFVLAGMMIPEQAVFIPLYTMFADWQIHNTYGALILPRLAVPIGVFLMTQFFRGIPREIEEAAMLDGAGRWTIFRKIMLPLAIPAVTTLAILTFLYAWNDYLWPLVSANRKEMFTITLGLAKHPEQFRPVRGAGPDHGVRRHGQPAGGPVVPGVPALRGARHRHGHQQMRIEATKQTVTSIGRSSCDT